jgi:phosphate-selective porin OprO/OprP
LKPSFRNYQWHCKILAACLLSVMHFTKVHAAEVAKSEALSSAELGDASPFQPVMFGRGVEFLSPDKNFQLALRFRMQNRADFIHTHNPSPGEPDYTHEWQVRRMRLRLNGHVINPRLRYLVQLSFSRRDQDWDNTREPNVLRDAMVMYDINPDWMIAFGQGKLPGNRQRVVSSGDLQFVDRSLVNAAFNIDRDFGVQTQYRLRWSDHIVLGKFAVSSGEGRNAGSRTNGQLFTTGRVEWLPFGEFARNGDYFESDLAFEEVPKLSVAYGISNMPGSTRANGTVGRILRVDESSSAQIVRRDQLVHLADALFKWKGFSASLEWALREASNPQVNRSYGLLVGQGYNIQLGKLITESSEVAARYSTVRPTGDSRRWHNDQRDWTLVFNHFLNGHRVKLQAEAGITEGTQTYGRVQVELGI